MRRVFFLLIFLAALVVAPGASAATLSVDDPIVAENGTEVLPSKIAFEITLSEPAPVGGVSVGYTTANGTSARPAVAPGDYTAAAGTATIAEGETTTIVLITTNADNTCEFDEDLRLILSDPTADAVITKDVGTGTLDNDDGVCLFVNDPSVDEGTGTNTSVAFEVSLNEPVPASGVQVSFNTSAGPPITRIATPDSDYVTRDSGPPCNCPLVFAPDGPTSKTVVVTVIADDDDEFDEQFRLTLSSVSPSTVTFGKVSGIATILDDDAPPTVSISDGVLNKSVSDGSNSVIQFGVSLSDKSGKPIQVDYETQDITAVAGVDYEPKRGVLKFAPNEQVKQNAITVIAIGDSLDITRTFRVVLTIRTHLTSTAARFTNADLNKEIVIDGQSRTITQVSPAEFLGGPSSVTLNTPLSRTGAQPFQLTRTFTDGQVADFGGGVHDTLHSDTAFFDETLDVDNKPVIFGIAPNEIATVMVEWLNAHTVKIPHGVVPLGPGQTFRFSQSFIDGTLQGGGDEQTLGDAEAIGTIKSVGPNAGIDPVTVNEGGAGTTTQAELTVTLSAPAPQAISLAYETTDGSAKAPADYVAIPASAGARVSFATGETTKKIRVTVVGNDGYDGDKTFAVVLSDPINAELPAATKTGIVTIRNDDGVPSLIVSDISVPEPKGTVTNVDIPVRLSGPSTTTLSAGYATSNITAVAGVNYQETTGTLTFKPGETEHRIKVPITGDAVVTDDLQFALTLQDTVPGSSPVVARVTLVDGDLASANMPQISVNDTASRRSSASAPNAVFSVRMDRPLTRTVAVDYNTEAGSALADRDFTPVSGRLRFVPGQTVLTIAVPVLPNAAQRAITSFKLVLSNPASAGIGRARGVGVLINVDELRVPFTIKTSRLRAADIVCRSSRRCPGVLASWTAPEAGKVSIRVTSSVKQGKKNRTIVLAKLTRSVKKGAGRARVRHVSRRGAASMLRKLRTGKASKVTVSLTFTTRLGEQGKAIRRAQLVR